MSDQGNTLGKGVGTVEGKGQLMGFVTDEVRRLVSGGVKTPRVWQSRRYLQVDSVRVDGRIVDVSLDTDMEDMVAVTSGNRPTANIFARADGAATWMDDNGRAIY